jgi:uncharacterized membrane protein
MEAAAIVVMLGLASGCVALLLDIVVSIKVEVYNFLINLGAALILFGLLLLIFLLAFEIASR